MKIKKYIYLLTYAAVTLVPQACKDFLDETDTRNVSEESLFKKPEDGVRIVNAIYDNFHNYDYMNKSL